VIHACPLQSGTSYQTLSALVVLHICTNVGRSKEVMSKWISGEMDTGFIKWTVFILLRVVFWDVFSFM
jgi:hypothetical protein